MGRVWRIVRKWLRIIITVRNKVRSVIKVKIIIHITLSIRVRILIRV